MSEKINKTEALDRIKSYYGLKNNAKLASFLGVAPTTISSWYARDSFDLDIIYSKCIGISFDWLFTGYGSKLRSVQSSSNDQSISGDNNIQTGSNSKVNAHISKDHSLEVLRLQISEKDRLLQEKDRRIEEKDAQIKEKDTQINKLLMILSK